jgi:hypothetical protein
MNPKIETRLKRRKYGTNSWYCWIEYRIAPETDWHELPGDPWPARTVSKSEALAAVREYLENR